MFKNLTNIPKEEFICGNKFIKICEEYKNLGVHFSKIDNWLEEINYAGRNNKHIFLTHQGDMPVTQEMVEKAPKNIKFWFAANCRAESTSNCTVIGVPLGLNNIDYVSCEMSKWGKYSSNFLHITDFHNNILEARKYIISSKEKNLAYCNVNVSTNKLDRNKCVEFFKNKKYVNVENPNKNHLEYLIECLSYPFIISPPGNGDDCIRIWESLYLGRIPVVLKSNSMKHFYDLPILFVDSWEEVTEEFLLESYDHMIKKTYNLEKLKISYWRNKINGK